MFFNILHIDFTTKDGPKPSQLFPLISRAVNYKINNNGLEKYFFTYWGDRSSEKMYWNGRRDYQISGNARVPFYHVDFGDDKQIEYY